MTSRDSASCQCENKMQFALPCRHLLLRAARRGVFIPQGIIHPGWFVDLHPDHRMDAAWEPRYHDDSGIDPNLSRPTANRDRGKDQLTMATANSHELYKKSPQSKTERLAAEADAVVQNHVHDGDDLQTIIETILPTPGYTRVQELLQYKKKHGKANERAHWCRDRGERMLRSETSRRGQPERQPLMKRRRS